VSTVLVHPDAATIPVGSALKNLAKIHELPPFVKLFQSERTAVVVVPREYAEQWRAALGAGEFAEDTDGLTWTAVAPVWFGACVKLVHA
jgi:hydrogenase maturation factor